MKSFKKIERAIEKFRLSLETYLPQLQTEVNNIIEKKYKDY